MLSAVIVNNAIIWNPIRRTLDYLINNVELVFRYWYWWPYGQIRTNNSILDSAMYCTPWSTTSICVCFCVRACVRFSPSTLTYSNTTDITHSVLGPTMGSAYGQYYSPPSRLYNWVLYMANIILFPLGLTIGLANGSTVDFAHGQYHSLSSRPYDRLGKWLYNWLCTWPISFSFLQALRSAWQMANIILFPLGLTIDSANG